MKSWEERRSAATFPDNAPIRWLMSRNNSRQRYILVPAPSSMGNPARAQTLFPAHVRESSARARVSHFPRPSAIPCRERARIRQGKVGNRHREDIAI